MANQLASEKSPYLKQHAENPVHWYPWGEEALIVAEANNKPIFLSIGYSSCYWCHVMEKECFESEDVARVLNNHFVCIKVDREERPDIDRIYMQAVVNISGRGGWPLSVFLTPQLEPFYGGTYFPKDQFVPLLEQVAETWTTQRNRILQNSKQLSASLKANQGQSSGQLSIATEAAQLLSAALTQFHRAHDAEEGGFGAAPKFPPAHALRLLLNLSLTSDLRSVAWPMLEKTLDKLARGGIQDQLGGGFHRYSVDRYWLVPHFEKMLYDNALLIAVYAEAFKFSKQEQWRDVAKRTAEYVLENLLSAEGGFFSAEDAGEVAKEGEFYVWQEKELRSLLSPEEFALLRRAWGVTSVGNFEQKTNILNLQESEDYSVLKEDVFLTAKAKLLAARKKRNAPFKDKKIITAWNGLMLSALAKVFEITQDQRYLEVAGACVEFIQKNLFREGRLLRRYCEGESRFSATADDYAFLIQGLTDLYQAGLEEKHLVLALNLQATFDEMFWDEEEGAYFYTDGLDRSLIVREKNWGDSAEPSANGIAALNLLNLSSLSFSRAFKAKAERILTAAAENLRNYPQAFPSLLNALSLAQAECRIVVIAGEVQAEEAQKLLSLKQQNFLPQLLLARAEEQSEIPALRDKPLLGPGSNSFYLCQQSSCQPPTQSAEEIAKQLLS